MRLGKPAAQSELTSEAQARVPLRCLLSESPGHPTRCEEKPRLSGRGPSSTHSKAVRVELRGHLAPHVRRIHVRGVAAAQRPALAQHQVLPILRARQGRIRVPPPTLGDQQAAEDL